MEAVFQYRVLRCGTIMVIGTVDETKNNGQVGRIEDYIGTQKRWQQRFQYDSLGRLSCRSSADISPASERSA